MFALLEVDVTEPRQALAAYERATGVALSFTAFIVSCVARAVMEHQTVQAYQYGRKRLILFDDVDVCAPIERVTREGKQATPYVIRAANRKSLRAIHQEIRAAQRAGLGGPWETRLRRLYPHLPRLLRWGFWRAFSRSPRLKRRIGGTVQVTAVGMFGAGTGWGISPVSDYSLMIVIGGIAEKPGVVDGQIAIRHYLCLTVSADHNVVDGAPLARFTQRLRELIESGAGLAESGIGATSKPAAQRQGW
jgi:pyruvate/2-oxoglutarate dehydrogenase complex dihydrolipoamide acyltransferase (E2) component